MEFLFSTVYRRRLYSDNLNVYYFSAGILQEKAISALISDPNLSYMLSRFCLVFSSKPSNDSSLSESENTISSRDLSFSFAAFHFDYFIIFLNPTIYFSELCASSVVMIFLGGDLNHISLTSLPLSLL